MVGTRGRVKELGLLQVECLSRQKCCSAESKNILELVDVSTSL